MAGLSLLMGGNAFGSLDTAGLQIETRAARTAKAQFKTPLTTPPWKAASVSTSASSQISTIKRMATIIDKYSSTGTTIPDVQTTFIAYKALDRLRVLAESAALKTTLSTERAALEKTFAKGLADLQTFLGTAPNDLVQLSFAQSARRVNTVAVPSPTGTTKLAKGVVDTRTAPVPGITGDETFTLKLNRGTITDTVSVDLSGTPKPPTLDSVAQAFNAAIASIPMRDTNGAVVTGSGGAAVSRWSTKFAVTKESGTWGLRLDTPGNEQVAIEQTNAPDALVVANGQTALDAPTATKITRFDDPTGTMEAHSLGAIRAVDREGTAASALAATKDKPAQQIWAPTTTSAVATDAEGYSYAVGTIAGDLGANRLAGTSDLYLTKLDSEGKVVWQQTLGTAATATGTAVTVAANGDIVVAGTVTGNFKGATADGDMAVARFSANGDEQFASLVRNFGADSASAVAVGSDGTVYVAGKTASGGGDGYIARLSATGQVQERRTIDSGGSDSVKALAIGADGDLLALTNESGTAKLHKIAAGSLTTESAPVVDLGSRDARAIAVGADGQIAVGGASNGDGFIARIDADLSGPASFTQIATSGTDQVDSLTFMGGTLYAGGRTTGDLQGTHVGSVDGFIARIDPTTGSTQSIKQFGQSGLRTESVQIAAATAGDSVLGALGLNRGIVSSQASAKLTSQTSLRAGDEFRIRINDGTLRRVVIDDGETLATLSKKVSSLTGSNATVSTPLDGKGNRSLRIEAKPGQEIELAAGAAGKDALAKLGIEPMRIATPAILSNDAPKVRPGGSYGLNLSNALELTDATKAASALDSIKTALSMTQTAYRSLYWDSSKEALANGSAKGGGGSASAYELAQAGRYQAALDRLTSTTSMTGFAF
jgi:WD40 repeat protein